MSQEFIKELERQKAKQAEQGGFNAPAPVAPGMQPQAPQELSAPQVGPTLASELQPDAKVPMVGGFEVRGAGADRFPLGTPEVPETLFSTEYTDPGGNTAAIAKIEAERARANAVDPQVSVEAPREFTPTGGAGFFPATSVPVPRDTQEKATFMGDVSTGLGKISAPLTAHSQSAGGFKPEQPAAASAPFGLADPTSSTATGEDPFSAPIVTPREGPSADPDQQIRLADPTSSTVGLNSTQAMLQERFGSPTISGIQSAEEGLGLRTDAQGRMIDPNVDRSSFEQKSADREARQAARPDFGEAQTRAAGTVTDAERRGNGAPTALFKEEAEAAGLSGRAKSDFISEKTRLWSEAREDREIERASGQAAGERANIEMQLKIKDWEKTNADERKERVDEMNTEIGALTSIIGQAENISGVAQEAGRQVGVGTAGFFSPLKWIGGTTAADLAGNLETIKSDAFVANITEMRKNSPTGGAVGNVSDKDLDMLQSLQTSFRQNLKPTTLRANLKKYQKIRAKVVADAKKGFVLKYGQENLNKYFGDQQQATNGGSSAIPNDRNVAGASDALLSSGKY